MRPDAAGVVAAGSSNDKIELNHVYFHAQRYYVAVKMQWLKWQKTCIIRQSGAEGKMVVRKLPATHNVYQGYTWPMVPGVAPDLLSAYAYIRQEPRMARLNVHPVWVLDYSLTACGRVRIGSVRSPWRERPARLAHLYAPQTPYWEEMRAVPVQCESAYILFTGGETAGLATVLTNGAARLADPSGYLGDRLCQAAQIGGAQGLAGFWPAQALLCTIIDLVRRSTVSADGTRLVAGPTETAVSDFTATVQQYLRAHATERVTLADAAHHAHVSVSTLSHRYARETGETPLTTLMRTRLNLAKGMLQKGERLKIIAERIGFSDEYHLSKTFKRWEGISPRQYTRGSGAGGAD
jgi:AraC-like DNA-binding protein